MWQQPTVIVAAVVAVEVLTVLVGAAVGMLAAGDLRSPVGALADPLGGPWSGGTLHAAVISGLLAVGGVAHSEIVRAVERSRRAISDNYTFTFETVWAVAAPMLLPAAFAAAVIVVVYGHLWWRSWRVRTPLYRAVFTASTVLLAAFAAIATRTLLHPFDGAIGELPSVVAALAVFAAVNQGLVTVVLKLANPGARWSTLIGGWDENAMEIATLCLGALTAAAMTLNPALLVAVLVPLVVLQRAALVRQLRQTADSDPKTGLLTPAAWHTRADRLLAGTGPQPPALLRLRGRAPGAHDRVRGVLMCDLDRFKRVNDRHGHLAGDHVLRAVAEVLRSVAGSDDLVARFGGEEFLLLLVARPPGATQPSVMEVAELIRGRVAALQVEVPTVDGPLTLGPLTVSIGAVELDARPGHRTGRPVPLDELIQAADTAMYAAKRAGRDQVQAAPPAWTSYRSAS